MIELSCKDECCGFSGTFCVVEEVVSAKMGKDCVAEYITGADMSCLMHHGKHLKAAKKRCAGKVHRQDTEQ